MRSEGKNAFIRIIEAATVTLGAATIVVLASVAGAKAYLAFAPSSLEAQVVQVEMPQSSVTATSTPNSNN